jgi:hypothetical protein
MTLAVAAVLRVFLDDPDAPRYGYELMRRTGFPSGKLYPILARLPVWRRCSRLLRCRFPKMTHTSPKAITRNATMQNVVIWPRDIFLFPSPRSFVWLQGSATRAAERDSSSPDS